MITKALFDKYHGRNVYLYELANDEIRVGITDFGAAIQYIKLHTPKGWLDVCLGFDNVRDYIESGTYCGATIGRVANRIKGGVFTLDGKEYRLPLNDGNNHLHGGTVGFDKKFYTVQKFDDSLVFMCNSANNDQGYAGNLSFQVEMSISGSGLDIVYVAKSDKDTVWNPTCHTYFNLGEEGIGDILLKIYGDKYALIDKELIPTGEIAPVKGTPFDFTELKPIGREMGADDAQLKLAGGYDHNYVLHGAHAATAVSKKNGITLDVYTDMPGLQFYSGNTMKGNAKTGKLSPHDDFCLEPQFFPNAVNIPAFETPYLYAEEEKIHSIWYRFTVK